MKIALTPIIIRKNQKISKQMPKMLFDKAACRCTSASGCKYKSELKVPPEETYLSRKMVIGGVDRQVTDQQNITKKLVKSSYY